MISLCLIYQIFCFLLLIHSSLCVNFVFEVPCKLDSNCCRNAYCDRPDLSSGGVCKCLDNYILQINKTNMDCLYTPKYMGESCEQDVQCQVSFGNNALCSESHCKCSTNTHFENGLCYKNGKIGDRCDTNADCYIEDALTYCVRSECVCHTNYHPVDGGTKCVKSKLLADKCATDSECTIENTRCLGECRCQIHYVANGQGTKCLEVVDNFDENCQEDAQCSQFINNGACVYNKCACAQGYHLYNNKCLKSVEIYEFCENDHECIIVPELESNIECIQERCQCKYGMQPNRSCIYKYSINEQKSGSSSAQTVFNFNNLLIMLSVSIVMLSLLSLYNK